MATNTLPQVVRDQSHYTVTPYSHLLKRFVEEARLLANLRHLNIVKGSYLRNFYL